MATPTAVKNKYRVMKKIFQCLFVTSGADILKPAGAASVTRMMDSVWVCAGEPTTAPTGISAGDLVLDTTNSKVYRFITGTTYVELTAIT